MTQVLDIIKNVNDRYTMHHTSCITTFTTVHSIFTTPHWMSNLFKMHTILGPD